MVKMSSAPNKEQKELTQSEIKDILQKALESDAGLVIYVGTVHGKPVNKNLTLHGTLTAVKIEETLLGFAVTDSNGQRTYLTREKKAMQAFLEWVKDVAHFGLGHEKIPPGPGGISKLDCPYG